MTMETKFLRSAYIQFLSWAVLTSLATTICTLLDTMLIGNLIGSDGLTASGLSTPVFMVYALLGLTLGTGANVRIGRLLGASRVDEANQYFHQLLSLGLLISGLCLAGGILFRPAILHMLGATGELYGLAEQYVTVVLFSAPFFILYHILSVSVRMDGEPKRAAIASGTVIVVNLVLDLVFMKGLNWGIFGASASLCVAEFLGVLVLLTHFRTKNALLKLSLKRPEFTSLKAMVVNGFGIGSAYIFQALVILLFNTLLLRSSPENGALHVAVFGVVYTISTIPFAVFDGAANALSNVTTILSGERDASGMMFLLHTGGKIVVLMGAILAAACVLLAKPLAFMFGMGFPEALEITTHAIRIFAISVIFTGINTLVTSFWQSIGRARLAAGMSVVRNLLLMVAAGTLLIPRLASAGVSFSYCAVELLCFLGVLLIGALSSSKAYTKAHFQSTSRVFENYYTIQEESVERISADLEKVCEEWEIPMKQAFFINLVSEELLLNIIKFGLEDKKKDRYISIRLMDNQGEYIMRVRDNVNSYNPFETESTGAGDAIDTGVMKLITNKAQYCDYQRKLIFNYLYLII